MVETLNRDEDDDISAARLEEMFNLPSAGIGEIMIISANRHSRPQQLGNISLRRASMMHIVGAYPEIVRD